MKTLIALLCLLLPVCAFSQTVNATPLKPPFSVPVNPPTSKGKKIKPCPETPPALYDLDFKSIYEETDPTASTVDPEAEAAYKKAITPVHFYETEISKRANAYIRSNGRDYSSAACALKWMSDWAAKNAMSGKTTHQGESVRKWALATFSSTYLQIGADRRLDSKQKVAVKKWLYRLARLVINDYTKNPDSSSRRNNHVYWAAWAVGMTGVALQHQDYFDWAMEKAKVGLIQIEDDGTLPLEVRRSSRAQIYHLFASIPLVMLAELGQHNGVDLYSYNNNALHRLVKFDIMQMMHSDYIEHRSGEKQVLKEENLPMLLSWIEAYDRRFPVTDPDMVKEISKWRKKYGPFYNRRIGGNSVMLYGSPSENSSEKD